MTSRFQDSQNGTPRSAAIVASLTALLLVSIKLITGLFTGSMSMVASSIDSGLDFLISAFNYVAIRSAEKPSDEVFNYGRGKIKALASLFEGVVIAVSALFIIGSSFLRLLQGSVVQHTEKAIVVMLISTLLTGCLVLYMRGIAKRTNDMVVKADLLHYRMDLWTNIGILIALVLISRTGFHWLDPLISVGIGLYIIRETYSLAKDGLLMLLDRALEVELLDQIKHILDQSAINDYHLLRTRASADTHFVDVHLVFNPKISLLDAHRIVEKIEKEIIALRAVPWVFNIHMDPVDDLKRDLKV